jgi:4-amino-4-deoxy-L-arabinose transferase-like glycosyltransferase
LVRFERLILILVLIACGVLYTHALDRAPVYLGGDEAHFAIGGDAVAKSGRNVNGDRWPLFFNLADPLGDPVKMPWGDTWYHPMLFYLIAIALKFVALSEAAVRLPNALIGGVLTPFLIYGAARRMRFGFSGAIAAAICIALSPTHYILSREALDYTLMMPFAAAWAWLLADYLDTRRLRSAIGLGVILGVGCYSYIASWGAMPFLLAVSWLAFWRSGAGWPRAVLASGIAFAPAPLVLAVWLQYHPTVVHQTLERYRILETNRAPEDQGRLANVNAAVPDYTSYFTWQFLFRVGGPNITTSTGVIGVFLLPVAVLFPIGIVALARRRDPIPAWPIVAALLFAPLPAAFSGHVEAIQRALLLLPFTSLIVGAGFGALQRSGVVAWRIGALVAVAAAPVQFVPFLQDYFGPHRLRSAFYFDSVAFGDVADQVLKVESLPAVFLRRNLDAGPARWRFHLTKAHRQDLLARTFYFSDVGEAAAAPIDSRMVMYVEGDTIARLQADGAWAVEAIIKDVDGREASAILRKRR